MLGIWFSCGVAGALGCVRNVHVKPCKLPLIFTKLFPGELRLRMMVDSFDLEAHSVNLRQILSERAVKAHLRSRACRICREADDSVEVICRQVLDEASKRAAVRVP